MERTRILHRQMDRGADGQSDSNIPPLTSLGGGGMIKRNSKNRIKRTKSKRKILD